MSSSPRATAFEHEIAMPIVGEKPVLVDLFAGCGGLSMGFELAGWRPILVSEINPDARRTYMLNRAGESKLADFEFGGIEELSGPAILPSLRERLLQHHGINDIDAVVGGPPCQGFSGIGYRRTFTDLAKEDIPSNHLYLEMVRVIKSLKPKIFLFENVRGILSQRWTPNGEPGEVWNAVRSAFSIEGYRVEPAVLHAKDYGIPQNRPRVFLVGIRNDVYRRVRPEGKVASGFLPPPRFRPPDPVELLSDLVGGDYTETLVMKTYPRAAKGPAQTWLRAQGGALLDAGAPLSEQDYSRHSKRVAQKFSYMIKHGRFPADYKSKKFAQRVLPMRWDRNKGPTITATSLPDDYVHYAEPRSLTVREWARLQTFPDSYKFVGKRTTGGRRRAGDPSVGLWQRDLPKYTQIGNAVPVLLARAIGEHLRGLLGR